jgi:hypothetical protein
MPSDRIRDAFKRLSNLNEGIEIRSYRFTICILLSYLPNHETRTSVDCGVSAGEGVLPNHEIHCAPFLGRNLHSRPNSLSLVTPDCERLMNVISQLSTRGGYSRVRVKLTPWAPLLKMTLKQVGSVLDHCRSAWIQAPNSQTFWRVFRSFYHK